MTPSESALQYADAVIAGKIPAGKFVKLACKRFIDDLKRAQKGWRYAYSADHAHHAVEWMEELPHVKGRWAAKGETLVMQPWQHFIECNLFGWLDVETERRRFLESYERVPRKNGKSFRLAARMLYLFCADDEYGAEVYSGATSERQAWEVFRPAREICRRCDWLREEYDIEVNAKGLVILGNGSRFEPVIGKPGDGMAPHAAAVDEYHEHSTDDQFETMSTGMGSRDQPLLSVITTAGTNLAGPCHEKDQDVQRILEGKVKDETIFGIIYGLDEGDAWDDAKNLVKANPNLDVSVSRSYLERQLDVARRSATKQNAFRTKHLNEWVGAKVAWMNMLAWRRQQKKDLKIEDFAGKPAWLGVDLASKKDVAALVAVIPHENGYFTIPWFFAPDGAAEENEKYREYETGGWMMLTPGNATDYGVIEQQIIGLDDILDIQGVAFDQWQAQYLAQRLMEHGLPMIEFPHQVRTFSDPMKEVEALVLDRRLWHDGNKAMTWMMGNVMARTDVKDNVYPNKSDPNDKRCKIDGVVGLIMAMGLAMRSREEADISTWLDDPVAL